MYAVENISNDPHQSHVLLLKDDQINLEIRYLASVQLWVMTVEYKGEDAKTLALVGGSPMLSGYQFPFDFVVSVSEGVDPFTIDCFSSGRCELWFIPQSELVP